jgi:hypothetical protein
VKRSLSLLIVELILLGCASQVLAQAETWTHVFGTYGAYSNGRRSRDGSLYGSLLIRNKTAIWLDYDYLDVSHAQWTYHQDMGSVAASTYLQPLRLRAGYSRIEGRFSSRLVHYFYSDHADIGNAEVLFVRYPCTVGIGGTYFSGRGYLRQRAQQLTAHFDRPITRALGLWLYPNYTWTLDGRRLYSVMAKAVLQPPRSRLLFRAGGMLGKRAYYFDNELLTVFNQNETQRELEFGQVEWSVKDWLHLTGEYIRTDFSDYSINYYVIGIRAKLESDWK